MDESMRREVRGADADPAPEQAPEQAPELSVPECLALLRAVAVSRIAVCAPDGPDIFPVNHVVDGGSLVLRTAAGTKHTAATTPGAVVAVEADGYDETSGTAWSVVVRGTVHEIAGLHDLVDAEHLMVSPWHAGPKNRFLRIEPGSITGRRFPVADPGIWESLISRRRRTPHE